MHGEDPGEEKRGVPGICTLPVPSLVYHPVLHHPVHLSVHHWVTGPGARTLCTVLVPGVECVTFLVPPLYTLVDIPGLVIPARAVTLSLITLGFW